MRQMILAVSAGLLAGAMAWGCGGDEEPRPPSNLEGCRVEEFSRIGAGEAPLGFSASSIVEENRPSVWWLHEFRFASNRPNTRLKVGFESMDTSQVFRVTKSKRPVDEWSDGPTKYERCPQMITFPAVVQFETEFGQFRERVAVQVVAWESGAIDWEGAIHWKKLEGTYVPEPQHDYAFGDITFSGRREPGQSLGGWVFEEAHAPRGGLYHGTVGSWVSRVD